MPIPMKRLWRVLGDFLIALAVLVGLLALLFLALGRQAIAEPWQSVCEDRDVLLTQVEEGMHQDLLFTGVIPARGETPSWLISLYADKESGAWTLIITIAIPEMPSGFGSCVLDAGEGLRLHLPDRSGPRIKSGATGASPDT